MIGASPIDSREQVSQPDIGSRTDQLDELMPQVYDELRGIASYYLRAERSAHTLQRTALVHEAYLRFSKECKVCYRDRADFIAIFARLMRETLTNYAIARTREKRGGKDRLQAALAFYDRVRVDIPAVDSALRELENLDPRQAQIVELRFFGGFTVVEIADATGLSPATVKREWASAKIWLRRML
jgi:RNA polymerase sigma-70 factor, ECF subfamily